MIGQIWMQVLMRDVVLCRLFPVIFNCSREVSGIGIIGGENSFERTVFSKMDSPFGEMNRRLQVE